MTTSTGGYNPLRWDCDRRGCWNKQNRPSIEYFAHALPGKISMTDIDATVEVNGHFLFLEWKTYSGVIPDGQRIYFERLTRLSKNITCVVVVGELPSMMIKEIMIFREGRCSRSKPCDLEGLFDRVEQWAGAVGIRIVSSEAAA